MVLLKSLPNLSVIAVVSLNSDRAQTPRQANWMWGVQKKGQPKHGAPATESIVRENAVINIDAG